MCPKPDAYDEFSQMSSPRSAASVHALNKFSKPFQHYEPRGSQVRPFLTYLGKEPDKGRFTDVSTQEVLSRTHELGQPSSASHLIDVSSIQKRLFDHETRKEERRIVQMRTAREKARRQKEAARLAATENVKEVDEVPKESEFGHKRKLEEVNVDKNEETDDFELKKRKVDGEGEDNGVKAPTDLPPSPSSPQAAAVEASPINQKKGDLSVTNGDLPSLHTTKTRTPPKWIEPPNTLSSLVLTKPPAEMRGHTSYLTFASFYPASIRQQLALQEPSRIGVARVAELAGEGEGGRREGSVDTEFGSEGMDQVMGTLTEEEMIALVAGQ
jgi:tRNA (adenine57-N1/adenine58-N1)-methyltransferase